MPHVISADAEKFSIYKTIESKVKLSVAYRTRQCDMLSVPESTCFTWRLSGETEIYYCWFTHHALTQKGARFVWTEQCQRAFDALKAALVSADVLALPREEGQFILDCDASDFGIGTVLSQVQDGVERPVSYASQPFNKHKRNYNVTRKELLAVVTYVRKFKQYLLGRAFIIRTDHAALQWLKRTPEPIGQQAR